MSVRKGHDLAEFDVVVAGRGPAGLSGALTLGRVRRSVLVVEAGEPCNAPASGVHGFLSRDGAAPAELLRAGREEVRRYGVRVIEGHVESASRLDGGGFAVGLEDGRRVGTRRPLVTTGLVDELQDVPGLRERWGRGLPLPAGYSALIEIGGSGDGLYRTTVGNQRHDCERQPLRLMHPIEGSVSPRREGAAASFALAAALFSAMDR